MKYILSEETKRDVERARRKRLQELSSVPYFERVKMLVQRIKELITHGTPNDFSGRI